MRLNDSTQPIDQRVAAAKALGDSKDKANLDALLRGLDIKSDALHAAIVEGLGKLGGPPALYLKLRSVQEPLASKRLALAGVRALKPSDAGAVLGGLLSTADPSLRPEVALALAVVGAPEAREALIGCLDDADKDLRYYCAEALASAGGPQALEAVRARRKKETDPVVSDALSQAERRLSVSP